MQAAEPHTSTVFGEHWAIFVPAGSDANPFDERVTELVEEQLPGVNCLVLQQTLGGPERRFTEFAVQLLSWIQEVLRRRPKHPVLVQLVIGASQRDEQSVLRALGALLKTAHIENPKLIGQVIELDETQPAEALVERLEWDAMRADEREIRYRDGQRWVVGLQEVEG
jgi:polyketide synthase PksN